MYIQSLRPNLTDQHIASHSKYKVINFTVGLRIWSDIYIKSNYFTLENYVIRDFTCCLLDLSLLWHFLLSVFNLQVNFMPFNVVEL